MESSAGISNSRNTGNIYRYIYQNGPCSRHEIAQALSLSQPTVTNALSRLRAENMIREDVSEESTGGRKPMLIRVIPDVRYAIGIDITKNHVSIVLTDLDLSLVCSKRIRMPFEENETYFSFLKDLIETAVRESGISPESLLGVGISLPVLIEENQKTIYYAKEITTSPDLYTRLSPFIPYPCLFFNDANSGGLAESWRGNASRPMLYLSLSNSVGGATIWQDQKLVSGDNMRGSEFGHMTLFPNGRPCYCGKRGCMNAYCNASLLSDFTGGSLEEFFQKVQSGENKGFRDYFYNEYLSYLALTVNNLRLCYDYDIILGGYVGAHMDFCIDRFRSMVLDLNPFETDGSFIRVCHYRTEASAVGAAIYYINDFVEKQ